TLTPKARASRKARSSDGTYFPASSAMIVCRVTPTRTASSCWVISPWSNRKRRIKLRIVPWTSASDGIVASSTPTILDQGGQRRHERYHDQPAKHTRHHQSNGNRAIPAIHRRGCHGGEHKQQPENEMGAKQRAQANLSVALVEHHRARSLEEEHGAEPEKAEKPEPSQCSFAQEGQQHRHEDQ